MYFVFNALSEIRILKGRFLIYKEGPKKQRNDHCLNIKQIMIKKNDFPQETITIYYA